MATAGFQGIVRVSDDSFVTNSIVGCVVDASFDQIMAELDVTCFQDTDTKRIYGLGDVSASLTCIWESADAGQTLIRTEMQARNAFALRYLPNGTNGFEADFICTSISTTQAVDGRVEVTFTLVGSGGGISFI